MTIKRTTLYINKQPIRLEPDQLIQSGGEGMVFKVGKTAVKRYHHPDARRAAKLRTLLEATMRGQFPANILGPCALVENKQGEVVGFQMSLLPEESQPLKQLSRPGYWQKAGIEARDVCTLFGQIHEILTRLHRANVVVGDLNDHNLFFTSDRSGWQRTFWIDADSYQMGGFPCPAAMQSFLDPGLYHVADFSQRSVFTAESDWYAFFVLLVKSLLQVHPFGGTHHEKQSLAARATAGISILDSAVTYPKRARPVETLSDELLEHVERVFEKGERYPFPLPVLENYMAGLHTCADCGLSYPQSRVGCPGCRKQTPVAMPAQIMGRLECIELIRTDGYIVYATVLPLGRIIAVVRSGQDYTLLQLEAAGKCNSMPLFTGQAQYRFGFFGGRYLVVNPVGNTQLLILDVSESQPQQVDMMLTAAFRGQAVFATTPDYLIRIAQGTITKSQVRYGSLVEETIGTARREQTWLWASPHNGTVAGYYRFFDALHLFLINEKGAYYEIERPVMQVGESLAEIETVFGRDTTAFILKVRRDGRSYLRTFVVDARGQVLEAKENRSASGTQYDTVGGKALAARTILHPTDGGILKENQSGSSLLADTAAFVSEGDVLHWHPDGIMVQQAATLYLLKEC